MAAHCWPSSAPLAKLRLVTPAASPRWLGAQRLLDLVSGPAEVTELAERLLADAWVVERLEDLPKGFTGVAATRSGRVWFAAWGEVRQLTEGGEERVLARRNERDRLIARAASWPFRPSTPHTRRRSVCWRRPRRRVGAWAGRSARCARPSAVAPRGARHGGGRSG